MLPFLIQSSGKASVLKSKTPKPKNPKPKNKPKTKPTGKGKTKVKDKGKGKRKHLGSVEPVDSNTQNMTGKCVLFLMGNLGS